MAKFAKVTRVVPFAQVEAPGLDLKTKTPTAMICDLAMGAHEAFRTHLCFCWQWGWSEDGIAEVSPRSTGGGASS